MVRQFLFAAAALWYILIEGLVLGTASAHRSGCHRWHTCPSDRGTYAEKAAPTARVRHPRSSNQSRTRSSRTASSSLRTPRGDK